MPHHTVQYVGEALVTASAARGVDRPPALLARLAAKADLSCMVVGGADLSDVTAAVLGEWLSLVPVACAFATVDIDRACFSHVGFGHVLRGIATRFQISADAAPTTLVLSSQGLGPLSLGTLRSTLLRLPQCVVVRGFQATQASSLSLEIARLIDQQDLRETTSQHEQSSGVGVLVELPAAADAQCWDAKDPTGMGRGFGCPCQMVAVVDGGESEAAASLREEEHVLTQRVAAQLRRLGESVEGLHCATAREFSSRLEEEFVVGQMAMERECDEGYVAIDAARRFECPYTPPAYDPAGPMVSPLRLRGNGDDELSQLERKLHIVTERLRQRVADSREADHVSVHRSADGQSVESIAAFYGVAALQIYAVNSALDPSDPETAPTANLREGRSILVPLSPELLLQRCLLAERAQALQVALTCQQIQAESTDSGQRRLEAELAVHERRLAHLRDERERSQEYLREVEWSVYVKRRDTRLRFLKGAHLLETEDRDARADLTVEAEELLHTVASRARREACVLAARLAPRPVSPDEAQLAELKDRVRFLCGPRIEGQRGAPRSQ